MAELTIQAEDIRQALDKFVADYRPDTSNREEVGTVVTSGDGIARVEGLPSAMANELLEFENGTLGIALNLDVREIGVVVMGDSEGIEEGQVVKRTGDILSVPVGDGYLGRVVDALGRPIDGLGDITDIDERRPLELQAAGVMDRQEVRQPMQTGIKAIDAMIPIGRGQRQLIIGDRKTGKSAIAVDTIINQRQFWESGDPEQQVRCIYVAIGQKGSTVAALRGQLEEAGAMPYTTIVHAPASDPAGYKYVAPYTGSAIGQHWMYAGKHVLIIFDDLTKQAEAYRAMSLLLRRPPGREAYPGDVFYLHSRLLERCAKLSDELGAGSMTGLPIIETKANDVSAYIPTNVISITDGQIFLQSDLFNANQRPAIDVGVSVSRVGGAAQIKAMKNVSGSLKINLAQYRDMQAFAMFASDLDATSRRQLDRGARLVELLRQPQYTPYPVEEQVVSVWAGINGELDEVPVDDVLRFEQELLDHLRHNSDVLTNIRETKTFDDDSAEEVKKQIAEFKKGFQTGSGKLLAGREEHEALPEEDVAQEQIVKQKGVRASMPASLRELRQRRTTVSTTKKITRAMELIAASRIIKAQQRAQSAAPFSRELTRAVSAVATFSNVEHPLTTEKENPSRAAMVVITSDRGLAGAYSSSVIKEAQSLRELLQGGGLEVQRYLVGRKAIAYATFRKLEIAGQWDGFSDAPTYAHAREISDAVIDAFLRPDRGGWGGRDPYRLHPVRLDAHPASGSHPDAAAGGRGGHRTTRGPRTASAVRVRAGRRGGPGRAASPVRGQPDPVLPAAVGGLRAGQPAAGHEVRHRQRPGSHRAVDPRGQPGPAGRDHPGDQRDRRRGERPR